jgi:hypothetical protein
MFEKLKKFWANPYAAPLTQAVGGIVDYARKPINNFIKGVEYVHDEENYKYDRELKQKTMIARLWNRADEYKSSFEIIAYGGSIVGTLAFAAAGAVAGAAMMGGVAAQVTAATVLGLALAGVGAVAGPFIVAGVFAAAGAMVGLGIGMVPGFFKGCKTALQHHKDLKTQGAVAKALPAAQAQDAELTQNLAAVMQHFNKLPKEHRAAFVRMMNEKYEQGATGAQSDKALAVIDAMPAKDREIFIRGLQERLSSDFDAAAQKDVTLQTPINTGSTIKLKPNV